MLVPQPYRTCPVLSCIPRSRASQPLLQRRRHLRCHHCRPNRARLTHPCRSWFPVSRCQRPNNQAPLIDTPPGVLLFRPPAHGQHPSVVLASPSRLVPDYVSACPSLHCLYVKPAAAWIQVPTANGRASPRGRVLARSPPRCRILIITSLPHLTTLFLILPTVLMLPRPSCRRRRRLLLLPRALLIITTTCTITTTRPRVPIRPTRLDPRSCLLLRRQHRPRPTGMPSSILTWTVDTPTKRFSLPCKTRIASRRRRRITQGCSTLCRLRNIPITHMPTEIPS